MVRHHDTNHRVHPQSPLAAWSITSRVVPAMSETMARSERVSRLSSEDLPTFGLPTPEPVPRSVGGQRASADERTGGLDAFYVRSVCLRAWHEALFGGH